MSPIIIAHRGASGYLPEHSMEAKSAAHLCNPNYIEQDVVMTKDNSLVVLHDHYLDRVTNVSDIYPGRHRKDGRYYVIDFTLDEIKQLDMVERFQIINGKKTQVFPKRFSIDLSTFKVHTLEEEIKLIHGMNKSRNKNIGIYTEIKAPWFHLAEGRDISMQTLEVLRDFGYRTKNDNAYFQCFDFEENIRIKHEILPKLGIDIKIVQLIDDDNTEKMIQSGLELVQYDYSWMKTSDGLKKISQYCDCVGVSIQSLFDVDRGRASVGNFLSNARKYNLDIHAYTFRTDEVLMNINDKNLELQMLFNDAKIDGLFTDFPDVVRDFLLSN